MNHDIDIKKVRLNCFRQSKVPGEFMLQMRIPGGIVNAKYLSDVQYIAETYGDGTFHIGMRQTFNIPVLNTRTFLLLINIYLII